MNPVAPSGSPVSQAAQPGSPRSPSGAPPGRWKRTETRPGEIDPLGLIESLHPGWARLGTRIDLVARLVGLATVVVVHGLGSSDQQLVGSGRQWLWVTLLTSAALLVLAYFLSVSRRTFFAERSLLAGVTATWLLGCVVLVPLGQFVTPVRSGLEYWNEVFAVASGALAVIEAIRRSAAAGLNPALLIVLSFVVLIGTGTALLMLPWARPLGETSAPWNVALFTSTSACCVTGLNVVDPGTYWSRTGQVIILLLIQVGGLGIMTFGAFAAVVLSRTLPAREHAVIRDMLDSERLGDVGRVLWAMLGFTFTVELVGSLLLVTLAPPGPWYDRLFFGLFHGVSAFCNAGFSLRTENLMGWETRWQVWGVISWLIILGGFGFVPLENLRAVLWDRLKRLCCKVDGPRERLSLSTRLVTVTTAGLLVLGTVVLLATEWNNPANPKPWGQQWANAWFHSVTLRTAGFNTIDHALLTPASKLIGIMLMFVGASPGSTGGGVKTTTLALALLTIRSVMRGRSRVEAYGRTISAITVFRGMSVIALALTVLAVTSCTLIIVEDRPERSLDYIYEAASALGTVGVTAGISPSLTVFSQVVVSLTMLIGRVGPLTLIVGVTGWSAVAADYRYPEERVTLG